MPASPMFYPRRRPPLLPAAVATTIVIAVASLASPARGAFTIDFENLTTGTIITTQYVASHGVSFSADNYRDTPSNPGPNAAVLFHSSRTNTADDDLEWGGGWSAGNIPLLEMRKFLVIAENIRDTTPADGFVDTPDDEQVGGTLFIKFTQPQTSFGFNLMDIETNPGSSVIQFRRLGALLTSVSLDKFTTPANPWFDSTMAWADHSANRITPMTASKLGIVPFDEVQLRFPDSFAIDHITFDNEVGVPEPGGTALLLIGMATLCSARRMRERRRAVLRCARRRKRG